MKYNERRAENCAKSTEKEDVSKMELKEFLEEIVKTSLEEKEEQELVFAKICNDGRLETGFYDVNPDRLWVLAGALIGDAIRAGVEEAIAESLEDEEEDAKE